MHTDVQGLDGAVKQDVLVPKEIPPCLSSSLCSYQKELCTTAGLIPRLSVSVGLYSWAALC